MPKRNTHASTGAKAQLKREYRAVPFQEYRHCRLCLNPLGRALIDLPDFPMTEIYVDSPMGQDLARLDQQVCQCSKCGHVQLRRTIPGNFLYGRNYATRTSGSSAKKAIDDFVAFLLPHFPKTCDRLLEIGCNDLYTLNLFAERAKVLTGIDPIWIGKEAPEDRASNIQVAGAFMEEFAPEQHGGVPDVVLCSHTLEHIDDAKRLIESLLRHASPETRFFFQFPGLEPLLQDLRFDQIHQQHLNYFSVESVIYLLEACGGELVDFSFNFNHWGALMIFFRKRSSQQGVLHRQHRKASFRYRADDIKPRYTTFQITMVGLDRQLDFLQKDRSWIGYGAALMLPLLAYHLPALTGLSAVIDDDPGKQGRTYINLPLPIISSEQAGNLAGRSVVVTAINSKQNVRAITAKLVHAQVRDLFIPTNLL